MFAGYSVMRLGSRALYVGPIPSVVGGHVAVASYNMKPLFFVDDPLGGVLVNGDIVFAVLDDERHV
jgi:hypothetical protein